MMKKISRGRRKTAAVLGAALAAASMLDIVLAAQATALEHPAEGPAIASDDTGHAPWVAPYPPNL
ncbi:hypothetical protein [Streptomyces europaeiscabiei]|uniref:hypothetical protein n=1 Tax=Streptomyces europaeiscabiei TaxID=146819 RepID=UPI0029B07014|nr:hypothetical protein [Streptomyces europaeiscabiei]MDX3867671.1 hypothetical protein [Streptomyces europaeiscabiei]MDX3876351.1 hypothetical protein [Streptomyces europaeiscabiei]